MQCASHLACTVKQRAVLASPGKSFVTLAQIRVLDGILDMVIVRKVSADLIAKKYILSKYWNQKYMLLNKLSP